MKSKVRKLEGTAKHLEIKLPPDVVNKVIEEVLEDIRKTATLPGFRQGKVPVDIIHKNYREDAVEEMKKRLVPRAYQQALQDNNIIPVSYPEMSEIVLEESGALSFMAKVDAHPDVRLKKYKGLKVERRKVHVEEKEVEDALVHIQGMYAEFVDTDRPVEKGDFAICDVEAFSDGQPISNRNENMWIEASRDASLLGMGEELCGLRKGDEKDIETTLPENYPDKKYAGRKALFKVKVKETKEKKLPELDGELAKKVGKETIDEVKEEVRSQLLERKGQNEKVAMQNQILEQLLKNHSFDLPGSMVRRQTEVLVQKAENELLQKGMDKDTIEGQRDELVKRIEPEARNKVKLYFILGAIANKENVDVSDEEVENQLKALAQSYNQPFENVKKYYEEKDLTGGLKEQMREDKTLDMLLSEANITDK